MTTTSTLEQAWIAAATSGLTQGRTLASLTGATPDGIPVRPLYLPSDAPDPARFPQRTSPRPLVAQRLAGGKSGAEAAQAGADALWIQAANQQQLEASLAGVPVDAVPLFLDAGAVAVSLAAHARRAGWSRVHALHNPGLGSPVVGSPSAGEPEQPEWVPGSRGISLSLADITERGGTSAQALGYVLSLGAALFERHGAKLSANLALVVSPGTDVFQGIALVRAIRVAWAKLCVALGHATNEAPMIIGLTSYRALSNLDPPSNMVRATLEAFALMVGGADVIAVRPYDEATTVRSELGERLARNTSLVLREESHLGLVADAARGSYYLDSLSNALAKAGWEEMRALEREGGAAAAFADGRWPDRFERAARDRQTQLATRKRVLVGVNDFNDAKGKTPEAASTSGRDAAAFEALWARARARGTIPRAAVARVGDTSPAREAFARRFFETLGFEVTNEPLAAVEAVVLCGSDAAYLEGAAAAAADAKMRTRVVVLAGKFPADREAELRAEGITHSIFQGVDVIRTGSSILDSVEAP